MTRNLKKVLGLALLLSLVVMTGAAWAGKTVISSDKAAVKWSDNVWWNSDANKSADKYPATNSDTVVLNKAVTVSVDKKIDIMGLNVVSKDGIVVSLDLANSLTTSNLSVMAGCSLDLYSKKQSKFSVTGTGMEIVVSADGAGNSNCVSILGGEGDDPRVTVSFVSNDKGNSAEVIWTKNVTLDTEGNWQRKQGDAILAQSALQGDNTHNGNNFAMSLAEGVTLSVGDGSTTLTATGGKFKVETVHESAASFKSDAENRLAIGGKKDTESASIDSILYGTALLKGTIVGASGTASTPDLQTGFQAGDTFKITDGKGNSISVTNTEGDKKKSNADNKNTICELRFQDGTTLSTVDGGLTVDNGYLGIPKNVVIEGVLTLGDDGKLWPFAKNTSEAHENKLPGSITGGAIATTQGSKLDLGTEGVLDFANAFDAGRAVDAVINDEGTLALYKVSVTKPKTIEGDVTIKGLTDTVGSEAQLQLGETFTIASGVSLTLKGDYSAPLMPAKGVTASTITNNGTLALDKAVTLGKKVTLDNYGVLEIESENSVWGDEVGTLKLNPGSTLSVPEDGILKLNFASYTLDVTGGLSLDIPSGAELTLAATEDANITGTGTLELHGEGDIIGTLSLGKGTGVLLNPELDMRLLNVIAKDATLKFIEDAATVKSLEAAGATLDLSAMADTLDTDAPTLILTVTDGIEDDQWPTTFKPASCVYISADNVSYEIPYVVVSDNPTELSVALDFDNAEEYIAPKYSLIPTIIEPEDVDATYTLTISKDAFPEEGYTWEVEELILSSDKHPDLNVLDSATIEWTFGDEVVEDTKFTLISTDVESDQSYTLTLTVSYQPDDVDDPVEFTIPYTINVGGTPEEPAPAAPTNTNPEPEGVTVETISDGPENAIAIPEGVTSLTFPLPEWKTPEGVTVPLTQLGNYYSNIFVRKTMMNGTVVNGDNILQSIIETGKFTVEAGQTGGAQFTAQLRANLVISDSAAILAGDDTSVALTDERPCAFKPGDISGTDITETKNSAVVGQEISFDKTALENKIKWQNMYKDADGVTTVWSGKNVSVEGNVVCVTFTSEDTRPQTIKATVTGTKTGIANSTPVTVSFTANKVEKGNTPSNDNGGGCAAGFAGLALLVVAPMFLKKK